MRESYLQRHSNPLATQADSIYLKTEDFETKTCSLYRTEDMSLYPSPSVDEESNELVSS